VSERIYVGVDIAGASDTWATALTPNANGLEIVFGPKLTPLTFLTEFATENEVVAVAIDAPLTAALTDETGFRSSDRELRELLPADCRDWVASANSLMAVPSRGRLLADALAPLVGTLLETHPRACLLLHLGEDSKSDVKGYKGKAPNKECLSILVRRWTEDFGIHGGVAAGSDGALDALVCATVSYCFHSRPDHLRRLRHDAAAVTGRGPFYVVVR